MSYSEQVQHNTIIKRQQVLVSTLKNCLVKHAYIFTSVQQFLLLNCQSAALYIAVR